LTSKIKQGRKSIVVETNGPEVEIREAPSPVEAPERPMNSPKD